MTKVEHFQFKKKLNFFKKKNLEKKIFYNYRLDYFIKEVNYQNDK